MTNAAAFGYGPASKILAITRALQDEGAECVFYGGGIAYEFVAREEICDVVEVDLFSASGQGTVLKVSAGFDYALCGGEPAFATNIAAQTPVGYVDSLTWMWDSSHFRSFPGLRKVKHYFVQNTFDATAKAAEHLICNAIPVEGIVEPFPDARGQSGSIVLNLGGVENNLTAIGDQHYPSVVLEMLCAMDVFRLFKDVQLVASPRICRDLESLFNGVDITFRSLRHEQYLSLVKDAQLLLTSPGLTATIEAFAMNVPTVFLMPQNYSQVLILRKFAEAGHPAPLLNWSTIYDDFHLPPDVAESVAVAQTTAIITRFGDDLEAQGRAQTLLSRQLEDQQLFTAVQRFQQSWAASVGTNGVAQVSSTLLESGNI